MYVGKFKGYVADDGVEYRTDAREVGAEDPVFVEVGTSRPDEDGKVFSYLYFGNEMPGYLKVETHECGENIAVSFKTDKIFPRRIVEFCISAFKSEKQ